MTRSISAATYSFSTMTEQWKKLSALCERMQAAAEYMPFIGSTTLTESISVRLGTATLPQTHCNAVSGRTRRTVSSISTASQTDGLTTHTTSCSSSCSRTLSFRQAQATKLPWKTSEKTSPV